MIDQMPCRNFDWIKKIASNFIFPIIYTRLSTILVGEKQGAFAQ